MTADHEVLLGFLMDRLFRGSQVGKASDFDSENAEVRTLPSKPIIHS